MNTDPRDMKYPVRKQLDLIAIFQSRQRWPEKL